MAVCGSLRWGQLDVHICLKCHLMHTGLPEALPQRGGCMWLPVTLLWVNVLYSAQGTSQLLLHCLLVTCMSLAVGFGQGNEVGNDIAIATLFDVFFLGCVDRIEDLGEERMILCTKMHCVSRELLPVLSAHSTARLFNICCAELREEGTCKCSFVRLLVSNTSRSLPSAAFTASPMVSKVSVFLWGRAKIVMLVKMSMVVHVKCPMCIAVDALGAIP
eukprot:2642988-Ditylum_brightwellii.AAC.2